MEAAHAATETSAIWRKWFEKLAVRIGKPKPIGWPLPLGRATNVPLGGELWLGDPAGSLLIWRQFDVDRALHPDALTPSEPR